MNIVNTNEIVPTRVRDLLLSYVPFGAEYVLYSSAPNTYDLVYAVINSHTSHHIQVTYVNREYVVSKLSDSEYTGYTVDNSYYCYASSPQNGVRASLPVNNDILVFGIIVIACLLILRTVFGGIKLWTSRKKSVV